MEINNDGIKEETENGEMPTSDHKSWMIKLVLGAIAGGVILANIRSFKHITRGTPDLYWDIIAQSLILLITGFLLGAIWEVIILVIRKRKWDMESFTASSLVMASLIFLSQLYYIFYSSNQF